MDIEWDDVRVFLAAAESASLSAAARTLGIGQATVSRRVAQLEETIGAPLFTRSVEGVALTDAGASLLSAARTMQDGARSFVSLARGKADELSGRVRMTAAPGIAVDVLAPFAAVLSREHPQLRLEIVSSLGHLDLTRGEADLALRSREPTEPELAVVAATFVRLRVYASASYLGRLCPPCRLEDLAWVGWAPPYEGLAPEAWLRARLAETDTAFEPVLTANDFLVLEEAAAHGLGAIMLPRPQAALQSRLCEVPLVPEVERRLPMARIFVVVARSIWRSPRVKAVARSFVGWLDSICEEPCEIVLD